MGVPTSLLKPSFIFFMNAIFAGSALPVRLETCERGALQAVRKCSFSTSVYHHDPLLCVIYKRPYQMIALHLKLQDTDYCGHQGR